MKKLIILSLLILLSSCRQSTNLDTVECSEEINHIRLKLKQCNTYKGFRVNLGCELTRDTKSKTHKTCLDNIDRMNCTEITELYKKKKLGTIPACFNYPKLTNKEICTERYIIES